LQKSLTLQLHRADGHSDGKRAGEGNDRQPDRRNETMPEEGQIFDDGAEAEIFEHVRGEFPRAI
jgi:hypothetical protein